MRILITAPNLSPLKNVSGISTVVNTIIKYNFKEKYYHYLLGRPDKKLHIMSWLVLLLRQLIYFPIFLHKNQIDIVHQNIPFNHKGILREFIINLWCRIFKIPVMLHIHGGILLMRRPNFVMRVICRHLFINSRQVIVLSKLEQIALQQFYNYCNAKVLVNCVDFNLYKKESHKFINNKLTILFIGRIHESKGINEIMQALTFLKKENDFKFVLCGTGPLENKFIDHCQKLLGNDFEFRGIVYGDSKLSIIKESDLFLLPSRYGEGLPMALLETMAAGVVPIVTSDASMKHVVQDNINGMFVKKNDSTDLYKKINFLLSSPSIRMSMANKAIETIANNYDIQKYIKELNAIYSSIL